MQYLKELKDGTRVRVTETTYMLDKHGVDADKLCYLVRTPSVLIYHTNGMAYKAPFIPRHKYGGRGRGASTGSLQYNGA